MHPAPRSSTRRPDASGQAAPAPVAPPAPTTAPAPAHSPEPGRADAWRTLRAAALLALGAAVSLGLARFSYALLLPPMRADLDWRYITAGAMNTANAAGYLLGALAMPALLRRWPATRALWLGSALAAVLLLGHGLTRHEPWLYALRLAVGVASAVVFVAGGLLAARLGTRPKLGPGITPGLVLGLYYGGTGLGIVACAALLPPLLAGAVVDGTAAGLAGWQLGWLALALLAALATAALGRVNDVDSTPSPGTATATATASATATATATATTSTVAVAEAPTPTPSAAAAAPAPAASTALWRPFAPALAGYGMFGLGYIGYMTFIVTLLREQGLGSGSVAAFYALLGFGVMASPWLWAGLLQRHRHGRPLATLNALLALATLLPVLPAIGAHPVTVFTSGALFGAVFLSVVASTTALVRHNLPAAQWPAGISAFTVVFAAGQIVGPSLVGWLSDGPGGLRLGLAVSAAALAAGALLASRQRELH